MARAIFWISAVTILYTYAGYPVVLWLIARISRRWVAKGHITPNVSVIIPCHNEADNIEARICNILESDYPDEHLELIIVSDGSTDGTDERARSCSDERVRVISYPHRRGKAAALNAGIALAKGDLLVFADARQRFEPRAIAELASSFVDPRVGAVSGELILSEDNGSSIAEGVGLYWRYEKWIRKNEARAGSVIGTTGAIYAARRALWKPLPDGTILDDVYTPMQIALAGRRVVFDEKARAHDRAEDSAGREFSRKVRTLTGNYQLCRLMPSLLVPTNRLTIQFISHKFLRLVAPLLFLCMLAANSALVAANDPAALYFITLAGQALFYSSVLAGGILLRTNRRIRLLNFAYMFSVMNAAAVVGLFHFLVGKQDVWVRAK
jgi:poly-beta-1,6-N-acetyl-D-glucosamine synthase